MTELQQKKRIAKNTLYLYIRMLVRLAVTLYTSRVVLASLGIDDYGVYNVVGGITLLFSFFQGAMSTATQRFMNVSLGKKDQDGFKRTFNVSMTSQISIIILLLVLAESLGLWFLNTKLNIPPERMTAANWVYQFTLVSCCFTILQTPYHASILSHEKMSFYAYLTLADVGLKLGIVFLLVFSPIDKLITYAALLAVVSLLMTVITQVYCHHQFSACRYTFFWDRALFREMFAFSGWSLCESGANMAVVQGRSFLINIFGTVALNAALGVANQVSVAVYNFVVNFQASFNPQIVQAYTKGDRNYLLSLINQSSKFSYFLLFALTLPLVLNMPFITEIWLKDVPPNTVLFCRITLLYYLIEALASPFWITAWAVGNIRKYQLVVSALRILILPITYFLLKEGFAPYTVLVAWVIGNAVIYLYRIVYLHQSIAFPWRRYAKEVLFPCLLVTLLSAPLPYLIHTYTHQWTDLIATTLGSLILTGLAIWGLGLTKTERKHLTKDLFV